ncbi:MAG: hypothetical protein NTW87_16675 [Planctomycetota bacterium]|nr:hypothetical protein [Planctomycetota bacterium]
MCKGLRSSLAFFAALVAVAASPLHGGAPAEKADRNVGPTGAPTKPVVYGQGRELAKLANQAITESSGVACSHAVPGVLWTHNDSGDRPQLYALNLKGEDLGTYFVQGASAQDWEDMCSFAIAGKNLLLVGDVGDNKAQRKAYTVYVAMEPATIAKQPKPQPLTLVARQDFTYEDGSHNCESIAVDPLRREIILVSKTNDPTCKAYVMPLPLEKNPKKTVAKAIATLTIPTTTAMDISPDGLRAIVLTYGDAYEYTRLPDEDWGKGFARQPRVIKMPGRAQGESVCYGLDGVTLYLTSEKIPTPLLEVAPIGEPDKKK